MKKIKYGAIGILIIAIFSLSVISMNMKEVEIMTNIGSLSATILTNWEDIQKSILSKIKNSDIV